MGGGAGSHHEGRGLTSGLKKGGGGRKSEGEVDEEKEKGRGEVVGEFGGGEE